MLSDFLGCHSVYSRGYPNPFDFDKDHTRKLDNAQALCVNALEPLLDSYGPLSIAYGYISPGLSDKIVKYQDPRKPSHHLWTLGAAADVCVHNWVAGGFPTIGDLCIPDSAVGSPIALAHAIDYADIPYSRLITYSESPYLCIAVSDSECESQQPRKAFYENRYQGRSKAKPEYLQYATQSSKVRAFQALQERGLKVGWMGAGYPTYHGGGIQQYQHMRVSNHTMVSDWLFDFQSVSEGRKNIPSLNSEAVQDSFAAAGMTYDLLLQSLGIHRASIVAGYVSPVNEFFDPDNDWRQNEINFTVVLPEHMNVRESASRFNNVRDAYAYAEETRTEGQLLIRLQVDAVLELAVVAGEHHGA